MCGRSAEEASDSPASATVHGVVTECGSVRAIAVAAKKGPLVFMRLLTRARRFEDAPGRAVVRNVQRTTLARSVMRWCGFGLHRGTSGALFLDVGGELASSH